MIDDAGHLSAGVNQTALTLAQLLPILGRLATDPLPELLRDSPGQVIVLHVVAQSDALSVKQLAEVLGVTSPTASGMIRRLVGKGLLRRALDPTDWRATRLTLTESGQGLLEQLTAQRQRVLAKLLTPLTPAELGQVQAALALLGRCLAMVSI